MRPDPSDVSCRIVGCERAALPGVVLLGVEEFQRLKFFCVRGFVFDTASEFASRFQWRVKLVGSTWVEDWYSGKPAFHSFDRTTRSANELVEGRAVFP